MPFSSADLAAIGLTLRLAGTTMVLLLVLCTPLAWWLAHTPSRWRGPVSAVVALPLVLPPTVIGFYLLVTLGPNGPLGQFTQWLGLGTLPFTFWGLVVASVFYSLPIMVQNDKCSRLSDSSTNFALRERVNTCCICSDWRASIKYIMRLAFSVFTR